MAKVGVLVFFLIGWMDRSADSIVLDLYDRYNLRTHQWTFACYNLEDFYCCVENSFTFTAFAICTITTSDAALGLALFLHTDFFTALIDWIFIDYV